MYHPTYLERDVHLYPTTHTPSLQRSQVIPHVPPLKSLVYDDVFEGRERDEAACGGEGGKEGMTAVCFELDTERGEDEEGFLWGGA